ncbi:MAG TPA: glutamate--cysteine ligase, partial [Gammaproteobacteria bacterium]|nr:glutamate--cysteine ligase [Gammaproteobacteria bacterium]
MFKVIEQKLADINKAGLSARLADRQIGLEREALRVNQRGSISQTAHPKGLGSPLVHPAITTDYSEALLEFITPPLGSIEEVMNCLGDIQGFVYTQLQDELLWAASMPCVITGDKGIPIATYGQSNPGMMKTIYRRGLAHRYGRVMQVIAGVHYNYSMNDSFWAEYQALLGNQRSLKDFKSEQYFALIRNLLRMGWMVSYLFGASPAVCKSFLQGAKTDLEIYDETTFYGRYATSLRMGDIGYQN